MPQQLTDQDIAQVMLRDEKFLCDLINSSILEASSESLRQDYMSCLHNTLKVQKDVFDAMNQKGWYSPAKADMQQVSQAQSQFPQQPQQ